MKQTPYLLWDNHQTEIHSVQALDELLDRFSNDIQDGTNHGVQLVVNETTALLITIGSVLSHVEFYSSDGHPPVVGYYEDADNDEELFYFLYEGEPSSVKKRSCVSIEKAREAIRLYFLTGEKPKNIDWQT